MLYFGSTFNYPRSTIASSFSSSSDLPLVPHLSQSAVGIVLTALSPVHKIYSRYLVESTLKTLAKPRLTFYHFFKLFF